MRKAIGRADCTKLFRYAIAVLILAGFQTSAAATAGTPSSTTDATRAVVSENANVATVPTTSLPSARIGRTVRITPGDTLKIVFYEALDSDENRWGADRNTKGFRQRTELSGSYVVQIDGTISLPLLGTFKTKELTIAELENSLGAAFKTLIGRKGFVNVLSVTRQPVYIVGPVKNAGKVQYLPGMTVLHAIALAGGLDRPASETWRNAEAIRETERLRKSLNDMTRLVARAAVIRAAQAGTKPSVPPELAELAGSQMAKALVEEEASIRRLSMQSWESEGRDLQAELNAATSELESQRRRLPGIEASIKLREKRADDLAGLNKQGSIGRPIVVQAQSELADVEERRQATVSAITAAEQRVSRAKSAIEKHEIQHQVDLARELASSQIDAATAIRESEGSIKVVRSLTAQETPPETSLFFEIIRHVGDKATVIKANEETELEPGDLVKVSLLQSTPSDQEIR
jgi:protein involved in polysaccharide export with SLBB domain